MKDGILRRRQHEVVLGLVAIASLWMASLVLSQTGSARDLQLETLQRLPKTIAGFKKGGVTIFEKKSPGLGYGVEYLRAGWKSNIFIYDYRIKKIPSGAESTAISIQIQRAKEDVKKNSSYKKVRVIRDYFVLSGIGAPIARCVVFDLIREKLGRSDSFLCLTAYANKFIKVRLSVGRSNTSTQTAHKFIYQLLSALARSQ